MKLMKLTTFIFSKRFIVSSLEHNFAKKDAESCKHVNSQHNALFNIHYYDQLSPGEKFFGLEMLFEIRVLYLKSVNPFLIW